MNKFLATLADCFGWAFFLFVVLGLFFVFSGEPDLWDKYHAEAMGQKCTEATK